MTPRHPVPAAFEPEYLEGFREIYEEKIVFNQTLGLKLTDISPEGRVLARNVYGAIRGEEPTPFRFSTIGQLAAIGRRAPDQHPPGLLEPL